MFYQWSALINTGILAVQYWPKKEKRIQTKIYAKADWSYRYVIIPICFVSLLNDVNLIPEPFAISFSIIQCIYV